MSTFATNLECLLQEMKVTQSEIANRCDLTQAAICQLLSGKREPSLGTLLKICVSLGITPNDLLGFHSETRKKVSDENAKLRLKMARIMSILDDADGG